MLCKVMSAIWRKFLQIFFSFRIDVTLKCIYLILLLNFFHMILKQFFKLR